MGIIAHKIKAGLTRIKNIKNIIAVTSGKGGVGKSTVAVNLAVNLAQNGHKIGLLDADIYGPSLPNLLGSTTFKPDISDNCFVPLNKYGIQSLSFGFLIAAKQPAIWRGAIVNKALTQLLYDTNWGELDILIIDMPPGTGDIHLTMCQKFPITATICVTTPQNLALADVVKSIEMYKKLQIPCLGIIENMSSHICSNCGQIEAIFGDNNIATLTEDCQLNLLGKLPLALAIKDAAENGVPIVLTDKIWNELYHLISQNTLQQLTTLAKYYPVYTLRL